MQGHTHQNQGLSVIILNTALQLRETQRKRKVTSGQLALQVLPKGTLLSHILLGIWDLTDVWLQDEDFICKACS